MDALLQRTGFSDTPPRVVSRLNADTTPFFLGTEAEPNKASGMAGTLLASWQGATEGTTAAQTHIRRLGTRVLDAWTRLEKLTELVATASVPGTATRFAGVEARVQALEQLAPDLTALAGSLPAAVQESVPARDLELVPSLSGSDEGHLFL